MHTYLIRWRVFVLPWVVAFAEGFSTLAVEVIAIRLAVPIVGSSITLTGVLLGVVLFALSAGYWRGGALSARWDAARTRGALTRNLLIAAVLYGAIAFPLEGPALEKALDLGLGLPLAIGLAASLLYLPPIYLASQTVPMLAELTNTDGKAGKASGRVLFFSTVGSVAGGIVTPVWLFPNMGVVRSSWIVCALLVLAALSIAVGYLRPARSLTGAVLAVLLVAASAALVSQRRTGFGFDSPYQTIRVEEGADGTGRMERVLVMGGGNASGIYTDNGETSFAYTRAVGRLLGETHSARVLVIGAAGFTFPRDAAALDWVQRVDAVDVDPAVKRIAEEQFLRRPLPAKIHFLPLSARYSVRKLRRCGERYGFTMVDAYCGKSVPDELTTVEFFRDLRAVSDHVVMNVIMDRDMESAFGRNVLASARDAWGKVWTMDAKPGGSELTNVLVMNWPAVGARASELEGEVYRDDRNSADRDHVDLVWNE